MKENRLDIPKIYGDPILYDRRRGTPTSPYKKKKETVFIETNYAILSEIPNRLDKVKVTGLNIEWIETDDENFLEENFFWVDYTHGHIYFHGKHQNKTVHIEYTGEGVRMIADSRVYHSSSTKFPNLRDKIIDVDRSILVQKNRVDELIRSVPQPSEVVDMRIDYNGKVFPVAKDRIDAEQRKIEEAYIDAKGKKFNSLKERIDSLQMATEDNFDEQEIINTNIWAEINLVPGKISMETGKLEEKISGEITKITSRIDLIPDQIKLEVQELKEYTDGEFSKQSSALTMLTNMMELKVDVNGVISSINLSEEGVAISGKKVRITGETHIENGVITSAKIKDLNADKIKAGTLRSQNNNTTWNLNTGDLTLKNADFTIGNGGRINFTDAGNKIMYSQADPQTSNDYYVGVGLGRNINQRFPFVYMGTTKNSPLVVNERVDFTGFIANTGDRIDIDDAANSVIGDRFHVRDKAKGYVYGFSFDLEKKTKVFHGLNSHHDGINYDIGTNIRRFRNVFTYNIRHNGQVRVRDSRDNRNGGWLLQTHYAGDGSAITFRGLNGGSYNYSIGAKQSYNRIRTIFLRNKPNVSSDARLKEDIKHLDLGLKFITAIDPVSFRFKKTKADKEKNKLEFGFIAQDIKSALELEDIAIEKHSILSKDDDGFYALEHEQFIAPIVNSIKELNQRDIDKDERIRSLEKEVKQLRKELVLLREE